MSKNMDYAEFLKNLSIAELNEMQQEVIKKAFKADDLMLLAPTGSGKTLAFLLPLISQLRPDGTGVQALIVAPSRELSLQIEQVFRTMKTSYKVSICYGGHSVKVEQNSLSEAPAVIIGTPGRLADHILRKSFDARTIKMVVLDEFDKSLQMGFHDQLAILFKAMSGKQRHLLTSATRLDVWPDFLPFKNPETINYLKDEADSKLELKLVHTKSTDKVETLMRLVAGFNQEVCLVFCNHREAVDRISALLNKHQFEHGVLHGAMEQIDREKNLIKFRAGAHNVLIATDLASRGLDIPEIKHVVHYQLPPKEEAFIHRNGRTARMHADGKAYLVIADDESLPDYIDKSIATHPVHPKLQLPPAPLFVCLYISAGKKDKISKGDIVGLLTKKGGLSSSDIGIITSLDFSSYVAVKRSLANQALSKIKNEKLKNKKVKIEVAN
ncbi:MAG TPA: helicase [Cytophagales bacterium]|nr:helicase [Cytophagales bacterium]